MVCVWLLWSRGVMNVWVEPGVEVKDLSVFTTTTAARSSAATPPLAGGREGEKNQGSSPISADGAVDGLCLIVKDEQGEVSKSLILGQYSISKHTHTCTLDDVESGHFT